MQGEVGLRVNAPLFTEQGKQYSSEKAQGLKNIPKTRVISAVVINVWEVKIFIILRAVRNFKDVHGDPSLRSG